MRYMRHLCLAALAFASFVVAGCSTSQPPSPRLVASTAILTEITQRVAGPETEVAQLLPDSANPHDFQLSAKDRAMVDDARLLITNGGGLEAGLALDSSSARRYELIDHVGPLIRSTPDGAPDPHVWMDPNRVASALPSIARALSRLNPEEASGYRERAADYSRELRDLGRRMARSMDSIPQADRYLVTSHDSLAYFGQRFDFVIAATLFPASGPEAEATAASVEDVESAIERTGVPAIFPESDSNPAALREIAARTGVRLVRGLRVETPSRGGYSTMLLDDARLVSRGLSR